MKYISYSLWGTSEHYKTGARKCARTVSHFYPGWIPVCYFDETIDLDVKQLLAQAGWVMIRRDRSRGFEGLFWRFDAAHIDDAEIVIFRDIDSDFTLRETTAVDEWINSNANFHLMRDHPGHRHPIMAGMWGCRSRALHQLKTSMNSWTQRGRYLDDQLMLEYVVYPSAHKCAMIHTEVIKYEGETVRPFPLKREGAEFVAMATSRSDRPAYADFPKAQCASMPITLPSPLSLKRRIFLYFRGKRLIVTLITMLQKVMGPKRL